MSRLTEEVAALESRIAALEVKVAALEVPSGAPAPVGMIVGACSHLSWHWDLAQQQSQLKAVGLSSFRDEISWKAFETARGQYRVEGLSAGIQAALRGDIDVSKSVLVLGYGNPLYGSTRPLTAANIQAYANYCTAAVKAGAGRFGHLQVWNEWNIGIGDPASGPGGTAAAYLKLIAAASAAIRGAGYTGKILTTGMAKTGDYAQWESAMNEIIDLGVMKHANGFGVHAYNWSDGAQSVPSRLVEVIQRVQARSKADVYVTECGWPASRFSEAQIGAWLTEFLASCKSSGVKGVWIYQLRDERVDPTNDQQTFGLFTASGVKRERASFL